MTTSRHPPRHDPGDDDARLIGAWLDDELADEEASAFEERLAAEPALRARLERVRAVREQLAGAATVEVPEGFVAAVQRHAGVDSDAEVTPLRRRTPAWLPAAAAAAVLVALLVGGPLLLAPLGDDTGPEEAAEEPAEMADDPDVDAADEPNDAPAAAEEAPEPDEAEDADETIEPETDRPRDDDAREDDAEPTTEVAFELGAVPDLEALVDRLRDAPAVTDLLGIAAQEADAIDAATRGLLEERTLDGDPAARCVAPARDRAEEAAQAPVALAAVAWAEVDQRAVLGHVFVSGPTGQSLDRTVVVVTGAAAECPIAHVVVHAP